MKTLVTQPYSPEDGQEFVNYMQRIIGEMARLQDEGRVPGDQGVSDLIVFWRSVTAQVRADLGKDGTASRRPITTSVPLTEAEHQRMWTMLDTLYPLLQILEMREAVDLRRTEGVTRVFNAIHQGTLT